MDMVYPDFYFLKCYCIEIERSRRRDSISLIKINGAVGIDLRLAVALTSRKTDTRERGCQANNPNRGAAIATEVESEI